MKMFENKIPTNVSKEKKWYARTMKYQRNDFSDTPEYGLGERAVVILHVDARWDIYISILCAFASVSHTNR